ncbi:MAG: hypothetical protein MGG11_10010 [Trichodesmium sp. MAG_R03]|nr:hypothetical protein [Trichodesmium sp. MAG_R03]
MTGFDADSDVEVVNTFIGNVGIRMFALSETQVVDTFIADIAIIGIVSKLV